MRVSVANKSLVNGSRPTLLTLVVVKSEDRVCNHGSIGADVDNVCHGIAKMYADGGMMRRDPISYHNLL